MLYNISGKTWLQTSPYMYRGLRNAIERRYEKYNILIGLVLIVVAIGLVGLSIAGVINQWFNLTFVILMALIIAVLLYVGEHHLTLRGSHRQLIHNFTKRKDQYRRLIPEGDIVFRSIMFPAYDEYLTGRKRTDIDAEAWSILENYVREVLDHEETIAMEIKHPHCTELEAINLKIEYEAFVINAAKLAGAKIAAVLGIDTGTFFDDRVNVLNHKYRVRLTTMLDRHKAMDDEAKKIIKSIG